VSNLEAASNLLRNNQRSVKSDRKHEAFSPRSQTLELETRAASDNDLRVARCRELLVVGRAEPVNEASRFHTASPARLP
jgi:hypothetical protein